jgi:hypothetical protein
VRVFEPLSKAMAQKYAAAIVDDGTAPARETAAVQKVLDETVDKRAAMSERVNARAALKASDA